MGIETQNQENQSTAQAVKSDWRAIAEKLSYKAIVDNIPFVVFLAVLCLIYISNSHRALEIERQLSVQDALLNEMRWKYLDTKSDLMSVKTETQIINSARRLKLEPSKLPAYKITVVSNKSPREKANDK